MALTRAPKRPAPDTQVDEQAVLDVIQRGGTVRADREVLPTPITDIPKNVQLRLYRATLDEIDELRQRQAKGRRPASRHAWIVEAIEEKLKRERQK